MQGQAFFIGYNGEENLRRRIITAANAGLKFAFYPLKFIEFQRIFDVIASYRAGSRSRGIS